ncbi:MAG: cupin domain-containing protein [Gammaproteobacteria bacterium]|nr:cupin domain-containing protein [Gammaproteobacteria bacterium]MBV9697005.1 cupin domain-containing protein [Gammaproteobacteria bacterium]
MSVTVIPNAAGQSQQSLESLGAVAVPLSEPAAQLRGRAAREKPDCGVWECSPGRWRRQVKSAEFCHFVAGRCTFTPDGGTPIALQAGDAAYFPANTTGVWDVTETLRKTYVIL